MMPLHGRRADILHATLHSTLRFFISALAGLGAAVWLASAAAQTPATRPIAKAVTLGESRCLSAPQLGAAVALWLGRDTIDARLSIEASDTGERARFTLKRDGAVLGSRSLAVPGAACADVRAALGLAIAVAIDATVLTSTNIAEPPPAPAAPPPGAASPPAAASPESAPPAAEPPPAASPEPAPQTTPPATVADPPGLPFPPPRPPSRRAPAPPAAREERFTLRAAAGVGVDLLTSPAFVGEVAAAYALLPRLSLQLGVLATSAVDTEVAEGGATIQLVAGAADVCTGGQLWRFELRACLGAALGALSAQGFGFAPSQDGSSLWLALTTRAGARLRLSERFGIDLGVMGLAPPYRVHLDVVLGGVTRATQSLPPIALALTAGPSFSLW